MRPPTPPGAARRSRPSTTREMRYFIVHLHRLLDPEATGRRAGALSAAIAVCCRCGRMTRSLSVPEGGRDRRGGLSAPGLAHDAIDHRAARRLSSGSPRLAPIILAIWHGQHFMTPFVKPNGHPRQGADLASPRRRDQRHRRRAARRRHDPRLGHRTVRISRKRAACSASTRWSARSREGYNVAMTADVPKVSRVAGLGIVKLAQVSGRPIYPVAIATRRRIVLEQLGPHRGQSAVRPRRDGRRRADLRAATTPTTKRWSSRAARSRTRSTPRPAAPTRSLDGAGGR